MNVSLKALCLKAPIFVFLLTAVSQTVVCQKPAAGHGSRVASDSPEAVVASMWKAILTTCPVPKQPGKSATFFGYNDYLYELRDANPELIILRIDPADKLNGVEFSGLAVLHYSASRYIARSGAPGERKDEQWSSFAVGTEDPREIALRGAITFRSDVQMEVEKRGGQWSFKVRSPFTLSTGNWLNEGTLSQIATKKTCGELTSRNPFAADR